ncbi:hypothetical protein ACFSCX_05955 [Bacillus salitolerans]|uniref:Competence protein CoiA-like family protein n=1 Tax=Bacillus salitolerans TaxID=1437434 RepID=A0ABW4LPT1_9BACI
MNIAILHNKQINIEEQRLIYEEDGFDRSAIKEKLENDYRTFSKKQAFHCLCCNSPVEMVLPMERTFYFRHWDQSECSYSENYRKYERKIGTHEVPKKHALGKTIIRTILEGQAKPLHINIEEGYHYKSTLSIVPDYIITHSNGETWAIDYLTGLRSNPAYSKNVSQRKNIYTQNGFKPIFFIDEDWLAYKPGHLFTTLVTSEVSASRTSAHDLHWKRYIEGLPKELSEHFFLLKENFHTDTTSLTYLNPTKREAVIIRLLQQDFKNARLLTAPIRIPIERALTIELEEMEFKLYGENETQLQMDTTEHIRYLVRQEQIEAAEREKNEKLEEARRKEREEIRQKNEEAYRDYLETKRDRLSQSSKSLEETQEERYKQIQEMEDRVERQWGTPGRRSNASKVETYETAEEKLKRIKREKMKERILHHHVEGESYIKGSPLVWKELVLTHFNKIKRKEMTFQELITLLKKNGIEFAQNESLVHYPLKSYLHYIAKETKSELEI